MDKRRNFAYSAAATKGALQRRARGPGQRTKHGIKDTFCQVTRHLTKQDTSQVTKQHSRLEGSSEPKKHQS